MVFIRVANVYRTPTCVLMQDGSRNCITYCLVCILHFWSISW